MDMAFSLKEIDLSTLSLDFDKLTEDFIYIKLSNLFPETSVPCDLFFPSLRNEQEELILEKLLARGGIYDTELHNRLLKEDVGGLHIRKENENDLLAYVNANVQKVIHSPFISSKKKTQILYDNAENIVKKVYRERPTRSNIQMGKQFIETFSTHLSTDNVGVEVLLSLFSKDYYTFTHSVQVALLGMSFCRFLGWSDSEAADFGLGALFHDIGKNSIDERILNKTGKLDRDEFELIKRHPLLGYQQLKNSQTMSTAQLAVPLHHHEASDGSGYPHGIKGALIHKYARLARIVDCYDALTSKRAYKEAFSSKRALRLMKDEMGHTFDSELLNRFATFLRVEEASEAASGENRVDIELGNRVSIQFEDRPLRLKGILVGMEARAYLILRVSGLEHIHKLFTSGRKIIARYMQSGQVFGFRSSVFGYVLHPLQLVFISYPSVVENVNLREAKRLECEIRVDVKIQDKIYSGTTKDISRGGCKIDLKLPEETGHTLAGEQVTVRMELLSAEGAKLFKGEIRNTQKAEDRAFVGIQFTNLSKEASEHLQRYVESILASAG